MKLLIEQGEKTDNDKKNSKHPTSMQASHSDEYDLHAVLNNKWFLIIIFGLPKISALD